MTSIAVASEQILQHGLAEGTNAGWDVAWRASDSDSPRACFWSLISNVPDNIF